MGFGVSGFIAQGSGFRIVDHSSGTLHMYKCMHGMEVVFSERLGLGLKVCGYELLIYDRFLT